MKGQQLTTLEDWVLKRSEINEKIDDRHYYWEYGNETLETSNKLAKLLKSKPKLGDFIPCDEDGNPLEEPKPIGTVEIDEGYEVIYHFDELKAYQEAERRVLWVGEWEASQASNGKWLVFDGSPKISIAIKENRTYADLTNIGLTFKLDL